MKQQQWRLARVQPPHAFQPCSPRHPSLDSPPLAVEAPKRPDTLFSPLSIWTVYRPVVYRLQCVSSVAARVPL